MSGYLPKSIKVEYASVRVKVIKPNADSPFCWYNNHVGEILRVNKKTWFEDGKVTDVSYEMPKTPGGGFNGWLGIEDIEVLP